MAERRQRRQHLALVEPAPIEGRVPPHNLDAEAAVLSAMLLEQHTVPVCVAILRHEDFYSDANKRIFEATRAVWESGQAPDILLVSSYLRERNLLSQIGGSSYLAQIVDATPAISNVAAHAKVVARLARRRRIIATCQIISAEGYGEVDDAWETDVLERVQTIAHPPADDTRSSLRDALKASQELLDRMSVQQGHMLGIPTPSRTLNEVLGGLHEHEITLLGARRGGGKTSFMCQMAVDCARSMTWEPWLGDTCQVMAAKCQGIKINPDSPPERIRVWNGALLFSQEMPRADLALRMQFAFGRVDMSRLRTGTMRPEDWARSTGAAMALGELPIEIDDQPRLRVVQLRARVQRVQEEMARSGIRLRMVGLDYVQIMDVSDLATNENNATRERQLAELGSQLVVLKKQPSNRFITWLLLVQINADGSARESKALEQAADNFLEIRPKDAKPRDDGTRSTGRPMSIYVSKQRNASQECSAETCFHGAYTTFDDSDYLREELPA